MADYISKLGRDLPITILVGLLFGVGFGTHYKDFVLGCGVFSVMQFLMYTIRMVSRIDIAVQELVLHQRMMTDISTLMKALDEARKEADRLHDRRG